MTPWQQRADALTRRMAEDMQLRNLSQKTIDAYTYHVGRFARFIHENGGRSVDEATPEDVRSFQLHLIEVRKVGWSSFNQAVCGLRFLYRTTVPRSWHVEMIPFGKRPKKLPEVLSGQEVNALLSCGISLNDALGAERERVGWPGRLAGSRSDKRLLHPRPTAAGCRRECSVPMVNRPVPAAPDQLWSGHPAGVSKTLGTGLRFSGKSMHCPVGD